ncbi:hypothetical protein NDU88_005472 [Pleurodeles waltl]|uniref:Uncharacterized protein n=1 Tax=Pleurodeles waltl TaxID=8319 RepID=A0AAV7WYM1_PLEWA|nr:hypothetical protein NDU88_005472 [Pleurodeles waltl]
MWAPGAQQGIPQAAAPGGAGTTAVQPPQLLEHLSSRRPQRARAALGAEGSDDQPVREPRGPESPSPAAAQRVSRRRAPHKAQSRNASTASGGGARAISPPPSDPRDAGAPELRCLTVPRGVSPLQRRALEVRGRGQPTAPGSELTRRGRKRRLSRPSAPLRHSR